MTVISNKQTIKLRKHYADKRLIGPTSSKLMNIYLFVYVRPTDERTNNTKTKKILSFDASRLAFLVPCIIIL